MTFLYQFLVFKSYINKQNQKNQFPDKIYTSSSSSKYLIPPFLIGSSIFIASSYKSFQRYKNKNEELINLYIQEEDR